MAQILLVTVDPGFLLRCFCCTHTLKNRQDVTVSVHLMKSLPSSQEERTKKILWVLAIYRPYECLFFEVFCSGLYISIKQEQFIFYFSHNSANIKSLFGTLVNSSMTNYMETIETFCLMEYKVRLSHTKKINHSCTFFSPEFLGRQGKAVQISRTWEE